MHKPQLLIIFARTGTATSTRFGGFVNRIKRYGGFEYADVDYVALEDLVFHIKDGNQAHVYDPVRNISLSNYDFAYFKSWQSMPDLAAAAAFYLEALGIPYADRQVRHLYVGKGVNYMQMWANKLRVPQTWWGSSRALLSDLPGDYPFIVKRVDAEKGKDNFLVKSEAEVREILTGSTKSWVLQSFIPNDGDYRIGVYGGKARWALLREGNEGSHLNNTSVGAKATLLDIQKVSPKIKRLAELASISCELEITGVDIVKDSTTGDLYVLEANQGSQIITGAFVESNIAAFDAGMKEMIERAHVHARSRDLPIIGHTQTVEVETETGMVSITARVDTGARTSSLHAENIRVAKDAEGRHYLSYDITDSRDESVHTMRSYSYGKKRIRSSFGEVQERYYVQVHLLIKGVQYETRITLSNRKTQSYRMLIGRRLLRGNFIVNAAMSE